MDFASKLDELNLTSDEVKRFSKAFKDEKFREMLREYAEEISNPETKKKYEEEITAMERERGVHAQFVHPKPHHALKVTQSGAGKCFVNVCSNELVGEPSCKSGRGEDGSVGQYWSLPYSLSPGRPDRDVRGNQSVIYDVVFHPDTLYMAGKSLKFMKLVNSTALQGIEDAFKVQLDKSSGKLLKTKYKGQPQPSIIRKPIPGYSEGEKEGRDPFPIPYPDLTNSTPVKNQTTPKHTPVQSSSVTKQPTEPHYTVKYRSEVDLQDYRCSRDSAPSPRPKEIVITIDLPAVKSAQGVDLDVTERTLVLECEKPAYRLELRLGYPVDEDKGNAKFNKTKKQLTITLPVLPSSCPPVVHLERSQSRSEEEEDDRKSENNDMVSIREDCPAGKLSETCLSYSICDAHGHDDGLAEEKEEPSCPDGVKECLDILPSRDETNTETPKLKENATNELDECCSAVPTVNTPKKLSEHRSKEETDISNLNEEAQHHSDFESREESDVAPVTVLEATQAKQLPLTPGDIESVLQHNLRADKSQVGQASSLSEKTPNDDLSGSSSLSTQLPEAEDKESLKAVCFSQEPISPQQVSAALEHTHTESAPLIEEIEVQTEEADVCSSERSQNDLNAEAPVILRERSPEDGNEVVISNHVTAAALSFQNSLCFELD